MTIKITRLSNALGAQIDNVDLREPVSERDFNDIHEAFLEHNVVLFRNQRITQAQHIAFSRRFGELFTDPTPDTHPDYPELIMVSTRPQADGKPSGSRYTGQLWHSDNSFTLTPAMGSLLRCIEKPDVGGDTMFANMYLAYETLSDGMKALIADLHGIHARKRKIAHMSEDRAKFLQSLKPIAQPVVRVHPETGRKALYVSEKLTQLVGLTPDESAPILEVLNRHATLPRFVYRHRWEKDDIVMWDNRCTLHLAVGDIEEGAIRHLERTTVKGTPSGYEYEGQ